jgi:hypothetical protein
MTTELVALDIPAPAGAPVPTVLAEHADAIRQLGRQVTANVVEIGQRLAECRALLKEDNNWGSWLKTEFAWDEKTARNFINLFEWSKTDPERVPGSDLPLRSLYALAGTTVPGAAREAVLERVASGETVTHAEVRETIRRHRTGTTWPMH